METQLRELSPFLHDRNPQVRQIALSNLLGQTSKESPHRNIFFAGLTTSGLQKPQETDVIRDLKLLCRDQTATAHDAFRALVNLSDSPLLVSSLSEPPFLSFIVSYIINPEAVLADLASMLLSNLTASSAACSVLLSLNIPVISDPTSAVQLYPTQSRCGTCVAPIPYPSGDSRDVPALPLLLDAFVQGAQVDPSADPATRKRKGELHFLSSVFANLSVTPTGRTFFLTPRPVNVLRPNEDLEYPLAKLVMFTEHKDTIRRGGVTSTLKNCAFNSSAHKALLSPESTKLFIPPSTIEAPGVDILSYLLLPLAGPEEFDLEDQERLPPALQFLPPDKKREPDYVLRLTHVETLLLLCTTRWGRDFLRENGVYEIVRATHENETDDKISEHIERLVNFLKGDEAPEDGETHAQEMSGEISKSIDDDDEDSRIEEV
ncbi:hypothetical protein PILCRDRAFT_770815 [Piloderma croceum F 1598]|uniref:Protein HGH1 homolog n=1 Tax=Piloderma croceum (strain F 1598) TaxID=765440 RepID=A0A0C3CEL4_PILCF|nr:hypothetical protein PILCRDRAFT_770815 [Piloderma croceum F 1598]